MNTNQYPTLRTRLALILIFLATIFAAAVSSIIYVDFKNELRKDLRHRLENITTLASFQQDGDALLKVQAENDENFIKIRNRNLAIKQSEPDLKFVYTMRKDSRGEIYFVVDAGLAGQVGYSPFGTLYEEPGPALVANFDSIDGTVLEPEIYTDEYGSFLSGYAPIYTSSGQRVGVLGVDISAETIIAQEWNYFLRLLAIFLIGLVFIVIGGVLLANYLAKPIVNLRDMANQISQGTFDTHIENIPRIRELAELSINLNKMTDNLRELIDDLEQRVVERTAGLTKKTDQLRAASYIARQTADVQDLSAILELVVDLITRQFGYYQAGIYLMNESGNEAVLQAASSEGGKRMVERGYAVQIGSQNVVGVVATQKRPRIALDIGAEAIYFNNPDLPMTRSEVALPLLIRSRVLGVLDIQSEQPQAFRAEDIDVFQTLADQVAVAIENARLLGESQAALQELEAVSALRTSDAWNQKMLGQRLAFSYTPLGIRLEENTANIGDNSVQAPITLKGQTIGAISLARKDNVGWSKYDQDLVQEVAYQVGLAVDNLRLLEDAQQRARQEQIIGDMATRFSQALDLDGLLQTAARELGQMPDVSEVSVFIGQMPEPAPQKRRPKRLTG